ncbi:MAG: hypothetical protein ACEPOZ_14845 [Marinifilaceae bacterium]
MFSIHTLKTVAKFEMRTLLRSWFFRIFAGLSIVGLGIYNIAVFVETSGAPWIYRALPASIPYANLIVLNLGQAIVAVFLASEFLKQDRKNDSVEVIYARSMTNAEYILGKALGILFVFFILNLIVLVMGMGFSFLSSDSAQGIGEFFFYPLLISVPTLVFILGLSFFLMILLKNQAITFIVLLGYIALTIFYLNTKYYHLFDYIAYQVPMMNSTIGGFGNLEEVLMHRGIYFFIGLGLILFTVFKLERLPQSRKLTSFPLYLAVLSLLVGGYYTMRYIDLKKGNLEFKQEMIALNNKYVDTPRVHVDSCGIELQHKGQEIAVQARLKIRNGSHFPLDTLIFQLNPALHVLSVQLNGQPVDYQRELHLLKLNYPGQMQAGKKAQLTMKYQGPIDERTHFLDLDREEYKDNFSLEIFRVRKRYAYLQENFVCLTSEALWYPIAGVGYASQRPACYLPDFTRYSLRVKTGKGMVAVSQGKELEAEKGSYEFHPEAPLPKISLLIGNYKKYSVAVDSINYSLFTIEGNQFFEEHFKAVSDSLPSLIRELKNEYESKLGLEYPFKRFALAEVPIHFALDKHLWGVSSEAVQPEILFYPEKGVVLEDTDFRKRKKRFEKRMKRDNEEVSEEELQARMFKRFVRGNYMAPPSEWYMFRRVVDRHTFTLFPNYYNYVTQLHSEEYPVLNMALAVYLRERSTSSGTSSRWAFEGISKGERINLELKRAALEELMLTGVENSKNEEEKISLNDVILAKGDYLFSLFRARYGEAEFNQLLNRFVREHQNSAFEFRELDTILQEQFGESITGEVNNWYHLKQLPGFLVRDIQTYKVKEKEHVKYQVRFKISNPEAVDGIVTVNVEMNDPNQRGRRRRRNEEGPEFTRKIHVPAGTAREVGFVFTTEPSRMNLYTHISENLPNNLVYDFASFDEVKRTAALDEIRETEFFEDLLVENEIVVDNEDEGFEYQQVSNKSYLKQLVDSRKKAPHKYSRFIYWYPPNEWKTVLRSGFYGKYVRSAMYTKTGQGDRTATWKAPVKQGGYYDIYCYIEKVNHSWRKQKRKANYNFRVHHEGGVEEVTKTDQELEKGWNYLGSFYVTLETAKVELSNRSVGSYLFADAIKWVRNK